MAPRLQHYTDKKCAEGQDTFNCMRGIKIRRKITRQLLSMRKYHKISDDSYKICWVKRDPKQIERTDCCDPQILANNFC